MKEKEQTAASVLFQLASVLIAPLYEAWVISLIIKWYKIPVALTVWQIYAAIICFSIAKATYTPADKQTNVYSIVGTYLVIGMLTFIAWGVSNFVY